MVKRLAFLLVFVLSVPVVLLATMFSLTVIAPLVSILYVLRGGDSDDLMDKISQPVEWAVNLPYKIMGKG